MPTDEAVDEPVVPTGKSGTLPWMARRRARGAAGAPLSRVPVLPPLPATSNGVAVPVESEEDQPQAKNFFRDTRVEIEQAFAHAPAKAHMPAAEGPGDDTDAPFQVTLPRGVIRQIRLRRQGGHNAQGDRAARPARGRPRRAGGRGCGPPGPCGQAAPARLSRPAQNRLMLRRPRSGRLEARGKPTSPSRRSLLILSGPASPLRRRLRRPSG